MNLERERVLRRDESRAVHLLFARYHRMYQRLQLLFLDNGQFPLKENFLINNSTLREYITI